MAQAHQGRRARVDGGRPHAVQCLFSDEELAAVRVAADRHGASAGAWCATVAVHAAREDLDWLDADWRHEVDPLGADWRETLRELTKLRGQARNIGGLLNQLAAGFNATGELAPEADRVLAMVGRIVTNVDALSARAERRLR